MKNQQLIPQRRQTHLLNQITNIKIEYPHSSTKCLQETTKISKFDIHQKNHINNDLPLTKNKLIKSQTFSLIDHKKSAEEKDFIQSSLSSHFLFSTIVKDKEIRDHLLENFKLCKVYRSQYLLKQNDQASSFFILQEGQLTVQIDQKIKRIIEIGECFGEQAILYSTTRSASIRANKTSLLWLIDRTSFEKAIKSIQSKNYQQMRKFIDETQFFQYLTPTQKNQIASIATTQKFSKGDIVYKKGELASSMYIIKFGHLQKVSIQKQEKIFYGKYFGEDSTFNEHSKWNETIIALQDVELVAIGAKEMQLTLGSSLPLIIVRNKTKQLFKVSDELNQLSSEYIDLALDCFDIVNVGIGEQVDVSGKLFFIFEGTGEIQKCKFNNNSSQTFEKCNNFKLFGSLTQNNEGIVTFLTQGKMVVALIDKIIQRFQMSFVEVVKKCKSVCKNEEKQQSHFTQIRKVCENYKIEDFNVLAKIGDNRFGNTFLVTDPSKKHLFALRCISKSEVIRNKLQFQLLNEKQTLEQLSFQTDSCVNLIRTFKDQNYIYFLVEYVNGLELFDVIRIIGILNSQQSSFYAAALINFLEQIHSRGFIHRDLKPENIVVTENGYLKLIDFASCKKVIDNKTYTITGTPSYMAPQIISGNGYSMNADLWSLGVMVYEFMVGCLPFGQELDDPYQIYEQITKKNVQFPPHMKDEAANSFICQLLNKQAELRLNGSYCSLKKHIFLSQIEWVIFDIFRTI